MDFVAVHNENSLRSKIFEFCNKKGGEAQKYFGSLHFKKVVTEEKS